MTEIEGWREALTDKQTLRTLALRWLIIASIAAVTIAAMLVFGSPEEAALFVGGIGLGALLLSLRLGG